MGAAAEYVKYKSPADLPATLHPRDVGAYLGVNSARAYKIFNRKDFPSWKIGQKWICNKQSFLKWLDEQENQAKQ